MKLETEPIYELAYDWASHILLGTKEELITMFHLFKENGQHDVVGTPWRNSEEKSHIIYKLAFIILQSDPRITHFSMVSECWLSIIEPKDYGKPHVEPRNDPNRKEMVICLVGDGEETDMRSWRMHRDQAGRCASMIKEEKPYDEFESWMAKILGRAILARKARKGPLTDEDINRLVQDN